MVKIFITVSKIKFQIKQSSLNVLQNHSMINSSGNSNTSIEMALKPENVHMVSSFHAELHGEIHYFMN